MKKLLIAAALLTVAALGFAEELKLASGGRTNYTIIYKSSGDVLLDPAVKDLAATLKEITGATFPVRAEADGPKIFIGKRAPGDDEVCRSRERRIKSVGEDLYIYGDYRYGTAGAIYNFLYYFCNCRWYSATGDKRIPKDPDLKFDAIDYKHVPSFKSLEHGSKGAGATLNPDIRAWVRRNNSFLMPHYAFGEPDDAWTYIGPVTHTLAAYMPPIKRKPRSFNADKSFFAGPHPVFADKRYFETNPKYFTLNAQGKRVHNMQLCFSNPEVRRELLKNVETVIKEEKYDPKQDAILDFTQNDRSGGFCFCQNCRKLEKKYQTPGGAYFDFLVEMGKHFAPKYPRLTFRFFAYKEDMTGIPPVGLKFPDNMSVIIAPLQQDFSKPFTHKYNIRFLKQMQKWGTLCKEIWLWNYPTLYPFGMRIYALFPGVYRNTENLKLAHQAGVRYIIAEQGGSVVHGCAFKELNVYLQDRMAEDVDLDVDATIKEFCDAVYGKASGDIRKYLKETDKLCNEDPGYFIYHYDTRVMRRKLHTPANLVRWQRDFDAMEAKVKDQPKALFNVRRARINLDAVTLLCYPECAKADAAFAATMPLEKLYQRYCRNIRDDAKVQYRNVSSARKKDLMTEQVNSFIVMGRMAYEFHRREQKYPAELVKKYGKNNLFTLMPCPSRRPPAMWDKNSACGFAVRTPIPAPATQWSIMNIRVGEKDGLPWNTTTRNNLNKPFLSKADVAKLKGDDNYHLFKVGTAPLSESGMLQLRTLPERNVRFFLGRFYDPKKPGQLYDFYLSCRNGGDGKGMLVDRLVIAKTTGKSQTPSSIKRRKK